MGRTVFFKEGGLRPLPPAHEKKPKKPQAKAEKRPNTPKQPSTPLPTSTAQKPKREKKPTQPQSREFSTSEIMQELAEASSNISYQSGELGSAEATIRKLVNLPAAEAASRLSEPDEPDESESMPADIEDELREAYGDDLDLGSLESPTTKTQERFPQPPKAPIQDTERRRLWAQRRAEKDDRFRAIIEAKRKARGDTDEGPLINEEFFGVKKITDLAEIARIAQEVVEEERRKARASRSALLDDKTAAMDRTRSIVTPRTERQIMVEAARIAELDAATAQTAQLAEKQREVEALKAQREKERIAGLVQATDEAEARRREALLARLKRFQESRARTIDRLSARDKVVEDHRLPSSHDVIRDHALATDHAERIKLHNIDIEPGKETAIDTYLVTLPRTMLGRPSLGRNLILDSVLERQKITPAKITEGATIEKKSGYTLYLLPSLKKMVLMADARGSAIIVIHRFASKDDWLNFIGRDLKQLHLLEAAGLASFIINKGDSSETIAAELARPENPDLNLIDIETLLNAEPQPVPDGYLTKHEMELKLQGRVGHERFDSAFAEIMDRPYTIVRTDESLPLSGSFIEKNRDRINIHFHTDVLSALERMFPPIEKVDATDKYTVNEIVAVLSEDPEIKALTALGATFSSTKIRTELPALIAARPDLQTIGPSVNNPDVAFYHKDIITLLKPIIIEYLRAQNRATLTETEDPILSALPVSLRGPRTANEVRLTLNTSLLKIDKILKQIAEERKTTVAALYQEGLDAHGDKKPLLPPEIILEIKRRLEQYPKASDKTASPGELQKEFHIRDGGIKAAEARLRAVPGWETRPLGEVMKNKRGWDVWTYYEDATQALRDILTLQNAAK